MQILCLQPRISKVFLTVGQNNFGNKIPFHGDESLKVRSKTIHKSQIHTPNHISPNFSDSHIWKLCANDGVAWMGLNLYHGFLGVRLCAYMYAIQCTYGPTKCQKPIFKSKHNKENSQYFVNKLYLTKLVLKKRNKQIISEPNAFIKIDRYSDKKMP